MLMKRYELTDKWIPYLDTKLFQIRALESFGDIERGQLGGYIESEANLDPESCAWVYEDGIVLGDAKVFDHAKIHGRVFENAKVGGEVEIPAGVVVSKDADIYSENDLMYIDNFQNKKRNQCRVRMVFRNYRRI